MTPLVALLLALLLAGAAAALAMPADRREARGPGVLRAPSRPSRAGRLAPVAGGLVVPTAAQALVGGTAPVLAAVLVVVALGARAWWRRRSRRRSEQAATAAVLEACDAVASELAAGQPPVVALARAAADWPHLAPVVETARLGGDVAAALRDAARLPGAADLRLVAAAWLVAQRSGSGLAATVARVGQTLRQDRRTHRLVESELASARATARLVAALPVLTLGLGAGSGSLSFLLGTPPGLVCLGLGSAFLLAGLGWIDALGAAVRR